MKISVFTNCVTRNAGGLFSAVRDLFTNEELKKCDIHVYSYEDRYVDEDVPTWKAIPMTLYKRRVLLYSAVAKQEILARKADVLHVHGLWRYSHLFMNSWHRHRKQPIVCSPHGMLAPFILNEQGFIKKIIRKFFFQKALKCVTCYHALSMKEFHDIRAYGLTQPIAVIPNCINLPDPALTFKKQDTKHHLLYLGRITKVKGLDLMLRAVAKIKDKTPELLEGWVVDLVGWDDGHFQPQLEEIVRNNSLEKYVVFHGALFGDAKSRAYATADVYILPSHGEALPMTILEAWSWKKPVIMTPVCNLPEGYREKAAIRIECDVDSMAEGIAKMLSLTEEERNSMGQRGYDLIKRQFTWDSSAKKMFEVYQWLLGKGVQPDCIIK
ncbi:glycosyltransferase [Phocaeicola sp.]